MKHRLIWILLLMLTVSIVACGEDDPVPTQEPTLQATTEIVELPTLTPTSSFTPGGPSLTPSSTFPPTVTPRPSATDAPAATAVPPTEMPAPYIHRVAEGETCGAIAIRYGLELTGGSAAIEQANNISCRLLQPNTDIVVPRPTGTATPAGFDATQTAIATALPPSLRDFRPALYEYCPVEDDTLTSIALKTGTTQQRICELNPLPDGLDCSGCDFSQGSVGFCPVPPIISPFNCLQVPGPTHTPTATPTFTGSETATPTPTYSPPRALLPIPGSTVGGTVLLTWLSSGELSDNEVYQVVVTDEGTGETHFATTARNSYRLPASWQPAAGQSRNIQWTVEVVKPTTDGLYEPVSGQSITATFIWQG